MTDDELKRLLEAQTARIEKRFDERIDGLDAKVKQLDTKHDVTIERIMARFDVVAEGVIGLRQGLEQHRASGSSAARTESSAATR